MKRYTGEVNGKDFTLAKTSPAKVRQVDEVAKMLNEWNKENEGFYLFDTDFRAKFFKKLTDVIFEWSEDTPSKEFFEDEDLEVSEIVSARSVFLARAGMIA